MKKLMWFMATACSLAQAQNRFELGGGAFSTPWEGYSNNWAEGRFEFGGALGSGSFRYRTETLLRSDSPLPVLGNINEALYVSSERFAWGRGSPREEISLASLDRHLNHRICQTAWNCSLGGPIGLHLNASRVKLSVELLSIPNVNPTPKLNSQGQLSSSYRWTDVPYQYVQISGKTLPLRLTSSVDMTNATLFTPGAVFDLRVYEDKSFRNHLTVASQRSKSPYNRREDGLLVVNDPQEGLMAVVNSDQNLSFPWQNVFLSQSSLSVSRSWRLVLDAGLRVSAENSSELILRAMRENSRSRFEIGAGRHFQHDTAFSSLFSRAQWKISRWDLSLEQQSYFYEKASGLALVPGATFALSESLGLYTRALLVSSESGERILSKFRAQDSISGGVRHDF